MRAFTGMPKVLAIATLFCVASGGSSAETLQYSYDTMQRLTRVQYADETTVEYVYDALGNRMMKTTTLPGSPTNNPPLPVSSPNPPNGATNVSTTPVLSWSPGGDPDAEDATVYYVHLGESAVAPIACSGWPTNFTPSRLRGLTTYYWYVVSRDSHNADTSSPVWSFKTAGPDLAPVTVSAPASGGPGRSIQVMVTVTNQGAGEALPSWYDEMYLSADKVWDESDVSLGQWGHDQPLAKGLSYTTTNTVTLPQWPAGTYHLILKVDNGNSVFESDEFNNTSVPLAITLAPFEITTPALPGGTEMVPYSVGLDATNGTVPYAWSVMNPSELPEGLSCSADGILAGTPILAGTSVVTFVVQDSVGTTNKALEIVIAPNPNMRPVISSNAPPAGAFSMAEGGISQLFQVWAHDPEGSNLVYSWTWDGADVGGNSSAYTHTTPWGEIGLHTLRCYVSDGLWSNLVFSQWDVTVVDVPIEITTASLPSGMEMVPYGAVLEATNGVAPYTWRVAVGLVEGTQSNSFSAVGTTQGWHADDNCWMIEIPFAFPFFGASHTNLYINSNGTITFDGFFSGYSQDFNTFASRQMIAALWDDLSTDDPDDIRIETGSDAVTVYWDGHYLGGDKVNVTVTLTRDGRVTLRYGPGNGDGGTIGVSAGNGQDYLLSAKSGSGSMDSAADILLTPVGQLPEGLSCSANGILAGTPILAGTSVVTFVVQDSVGAQANKALEVVIAPNPNMRPVISSNAPPAGAFSMAEGGISQLFQVWAHDPEGSNLVYSWTWDGADVGGNSSAYTHTTPWGEIGLHTLRCYVSDGLWSNLVFSQWDVTVVDVPIEITTASLPSGMEMVPYGAVLEATNGVAPYTWRVAVGLVEGTQSNSFSAVGTTQGWHADDNCWMIEIPFAFPFFGASHTNLYINSNGTITFDGFFSGYSQDFNTFASRQMIAALWDDLSTDDPDDIRIETGSDAVTVYWDGHYLGGDKVNVTVTLTRDGRVTLRYGPGNGDGGTIGVSAGNGQDYLLSAKSGSGSMDSAADILLTPVGQLPEGLSCSANGILAGTPILAGTSVVTFVVQDSVGASTNKPLEIVIEADLATNNVPKWWLAQYGLTNYNVDAMRDVDRDGMLTWQEWVAGCNPTNINSVFRFTSADDAPGQGIVVRWPSVSNRFYNLSRATNLLAGTNAFVILLGASNMPATPTENSYTDSVQGVGPYFYKIDVWK